MNLSRNNFEGTIPTEIGRLSSLTHLYLSSAQMSGKIPQEMENCTSLRGLHLATNSLTGRIPDMFGNILNMNTLLLHENKFTGQIPKSIWELNSLISILLQNNDMRGSVPDEFCSKVNSTFSIDDTIWFSLEPKIDCACCKVDASCNIWDPATKSIPCHSNNIRNFRSEVALKVEDLVNETHVKITDPGDVCFSPTGCYQLFTLELETNTFTEDTFYGYSNSSNSLQDRTDSICDAINVCGNIIHSSHPRRNKLNHLTQTVIPDLNLLQYASSSYHNSICWMFDEMNGDLLFDNYEVCDGTLLQRYVVAFLFDSFHLFDNDPPLGTLHTCDWPGITCDESSTFITHIALSGRDIVGTLPSEIGLLERLEHIDLSGNRLSGSIDPNTFIHKHNLKTFIIGNNEMSGEIPKELFMMPQIKEIHMADNRFVGSFPPDISYSATLGKIYLVCNVCHSLFQEFIYF